LVATALVFAVLASPAAAAPAGHTVENPEASYTTIRVEGIFSAPTGGLAFAGFQISSDGVDFEGGTQEYSRFGGDPALEVAHEFTGLAPGTQYWIRFGGEETRPDGFRQITFSDPVQVTTLPVSKPKVLSVDNASAVSYVTAHASGSVERGVGGDPANDAECHFEYVTEAQFEASGFQEAAQAACNVNPLTAAGPTPVSTDIGGLLPATTYHLRLTVSALGVGESQEANSTFTTLPMAKPTVLSVDDASGVAYTAAEVSGVVQRPAGADASFNADCRFEYVSEAQYEFTGFDEAARTACTPNPITTTGPKAVTAVLSGLVVGTTYHLRLAASNPAGQDSKEAATFTTLVPGPPLVAIDSPTAATATSVHLSGQIDPDGTDPGFNVNWHFECEPSCPGVEGTISADTASHLVEGTATGLDPNTEYEVKLVAANAGSQASAGPVFFSTLSAGPVPSTMPAYPLGGGTEALVGGYVDANHSPTVFWIEYGLTESYGQAVPASQNADAGVGTVPAFVSQRLTGLAPSTTYHYRLVASNASGTVRGEDLTFSTPAATALGTGVGGLLLPDNRAWEKVSPEDKNNGEAWKNAAVASADGNRLLFKSQASFAGQPTSRGGQLTDYMSTRGTTSWTTRGIAPPGGRFNFNSGYIRFAEDLSVGLLSRTETEGEAPIDPEFPDTAAGPGNHFHYYLRLANGQFKLVSGSEPGAFGGTFLDASADMNHLLLESREELAPNGVCKGGKKATLPTCLFERVNGAYRLASVLPDGSAAMKVSTPRMSGDGSRIYFSSGEMLYVRVNGAVTEEVGVSERATPPPTPGGTTSLVAIDEVDGSRALLMSTAELVDGDDNAGADLYLWDAARPLGARLTLVSQGGLGDGGVLGVAATGRELHNVYFVTQDPILSADPTPPGPKLYSWEDSGSQSALDYVGTLDFGDGSNWNGEHRLFGTARVSANGRYLAFLTATRMTAYDNASQQQIYLYDSGERQLECATCKPSGAPTSTAPTYDALFEDQVVSVQQDLRNVSDNGQLFFQSQDGLVPKDSNGQQDVYEFEDHSPFLISSGVGRVKSRFLDAGADGDAVFFQTVDKLVGWDKDGNADAYVARVDGGLPEPPLGSTDCEGDSCQPAPNPPVDSTPASASFRGAGNVKPARHKQRRHRAKKKHKKHQHGKKKHKKSRNGASRKGGSA
jgi:hypothetical protein